MRKGISVLYGGFRRWAREPLLHFLLIGAALFVIYHWLNPIAINSHTSQRIELTNDDIRQLEISWTAQWQRPPTPEEMRNLVEDKVRHEILYREAWRSVWIEQSVDADTGGKKHLKAARRQ